MKIRTWFKKTQIGRVVWRVIIGAIGGLITVLGAIALAGPGPGILILLAGLGMFEEILPKAEDDTAENRRNLLFDDMMRLNGKQTIYQMIQLADRVKERGGQPEDPLIYKHEYLRRLGLKIQVRLDGLCRTDESAQNWDTMSESNSEPPSE